MPKFVCGCVARIKPMLPLQSELRNILNHALVQPFSVEPVSGLARLLAGEIFEVDALPDFARNTMARRESCKRRLGCGIDAPLCGVAVFLG